jgi:RimJ/RimL family protein N-acetyltransferase
MQELPETLPLPIFTSVSIGEMTGKTGEVFNIVIGLDKGHVAQLKKYSLDMSDTDLQENTSDFARFGDGSYEEWYAKDRVPFALVHKETGTLAALIWFGPKPFGRKSLKHLSAEERAQDEKQMDSGNWHTIVFRAYNPYRGQGLMKGFALKTIEIYKHYFPSARIWAGINAKNAASIALSEKIGLHKEASVSDENWTAMISE